MKTKYLVLGLAITLVSACSTKKLVIEELTIAEPAQYTKFIEEQISVSTKDSVRVKVLGKETGKVYLRNRLLKDQVTENYKFTSDSLLINDPYFHSVVGIKAISEVKFKGVWEDELGFVSEKVLNENISKGYPWLGGAVGALAGGAIGVLIRTNTKSESGRGLSGFSTTLTDGIFKIVIGGLVGFVVGYIVGTPQPSVEDSIMNIKEKRKHN